MEWRSHQHYGICSPSLYSSIGIILLFIKWMMSILIFTRWVTILSWTGSATNAACRRLWTKKRYWITSNCMRNNPLKFICLFRTKQRLKTSLINLQILCPRRSISHLDVTQFILMVRGNNNIFQQQLDFFFCHLELFRQQLVIDIRFVHVFDHFKQINRLRIRQNRREILEIYSNDQALLELQKGNHTNSLMTLIMTNTYFRSFGRSPLE